MGYGYSVFHTTSYMRIDLLCSGWFQISYTEAKIVDKPVGGVLREVEKEL